MTTTIKVSDDLRDRLKVQAARDGKTLGAHLADLADAFDRQQRFDALRTAIARTTASSMAEHRAESDEWERTELADSSD